jgi:UDP-2,3-diacylglucosamine pyrophosphatase LpxH
MYAHITGLYNHYYCSSYENGDKCGLRGVNKENTEACIYDIICTRAFNDAFQEEGTLFTSFFNLDKKTEEQIKKDIDLDKSLITNLTEEIEERENSILTYMRQQGKYSNNQKMIDNYDSLIAEEREKINQLEKDKINAEIRIKNNKRKLQLERGINPLLQSIQEKKDLITIQEIFNSVIDNIKVYNADVNCTIIRVTYLNGKYDEFIYAPRLMRTGFLLLSNEHLNILHYDERTNLIHSDYYPLSIGLNGTIMWDDNTTRSKEEEKIIQEAKELLREKSTFLLEEIPSDTTLEEYRAIQFPYQFNEDFTVDAFVRIMRDTSKVRQYERLEELSEKALEQQKHYREWRKKYNTGKPTQEPWVLRDANYDRICQERKKLYNRRYKIKNHKSLSREEKEKQLEEIQQKLDILSAQIQYLPK